MFSKKCFDDHFNWEKTVCFEYNDLVERQALRNRLEHLAELYPEEGFYFSKPCDQAGYKLYHIAIYSLDRRRIGFNFFLRDLCFLGFKFGELSPIPI